MHGFCLAALAVLLTGEIVGPDEFPEHRFARLQANGGGSSSFAWSAWPRGLLDLEASPTGESLLFVGPPGEYELELLEIGPSGDDERPFKIERKYKTVRIRGRVPPGPSPPGPGPAPGPGPSPPAPPPAPLPEGKFGLAAKMFAWGQALAIPERAADAAKLAAAFEETARKAKLPIEQDGYGSLTALRDGWLAANRAALGERLAGWAPVNLEIQKSFAELQKAKRFPDVATAGTAIAELALGLRALAALPASPASPASPNP